MNIEAASKNTPDQELHQKGLEHYQSAQFQDAIDEFKRALCHNRDRPDTHTLLGMAYSSIGNPERAIDHFQVAGTLAPDHTETCYRLAIERMRIGRHTEALSAIRQARKYAYNPSNPQLLKAACSIITRLGDDFDINPHFVEEVTACVTSKDVESYELIPVAQKLLMHQPVAKKLLEFFSADSAGDFKALLEDTSLQWPVLNNPLFLRIMTDAPLFDEAIEIILRGLRMHFLDMAQDETLSDEVLWPEALKFVCALSNQCFANEFIYDVTDDEREQVKTLENKVGSTSATSPYDVALLGCYKPLITYDFAQDLAENEILMQNKALAETLRIQIVEPLEEHKIREELTNLTAIDDKVSLAVKDQYESNPYPRWSVAAMEPRPSIRELLAKNFSFLDKDALPPEEILKENLIAGCGTGQQPIKWAMLYPHTNNTAVDISAASLSYAVRKTREMGIENVEYGLADILKLEELGKQFGLIQSVGVLHHMADPLKGWRVLEKLLRPGGFMIIGLYSELARSHVKLARSYIKKHKIPSTPEGIRQLREHIRGLPPTDPMTVAMRTPDFYSLSECRDLLFHVQEHRYTPLQIKTALDDLGLEFLGFMSPPGPEIVNHYKSLYPDDPHANNLENWHRYEQQNPLTFLGMYQFWVRKPEK